MTLIFSAAIKPTASIAKAQQTVNLSSQREEKLIIVGRHDPCIVPRALPVIEGACALALTDLWLSGEKTGGEGE